MAPLGRRRYSSRAACWSSGNPSKPSACENRTTVLEEVFARLASSSAVWNAASSRWSTMYCATSFWDREKSSKRERMYAERAWRESSDDFEARGVVVDWVELTACFIGRRVIRRPPAAFLQNALSRCPARAPDSACAPPESG